MVNEEKVRWAMNTFLPFRALGPNGIYLKCLQKEFDLIIKSLIKV